jgi:long-subunit acyl-CoA synthetase (AMP-forming)
MLTGSAPLGVEVQKYVQTVYECRVRQGYGLTETCAATCITLASDNSTSCVGPPQESAVIKLRDWEEGGYRNSDKDGAGGMRRGEILIGGPTVCDGYLVDPAAPDADIVAKNAEDFVTLDGVRYFCTGDIGQITPAGNLQIIDRTKDLVKLQMGEYVALSKVENALKSSKYTALPMVYATSSMSYAIALICPNVPNLKTLAASLGVDAGASLGALCANKDVVAAVLKDVKETCAAAKLAKFEVPGKIVLIEELWTPENEMLTAVQKLKRREIVAKHKSAIDQVYV